MTLELNKIHCCNCLDFMRTMPDQCVDLVLTDPPYGIDYQSAWRIDKSQWKDKIENDKTPFTAWIKDAYRILKDAGRLVCFYRWDVQNDFLSNIENAGFVVKSQVIWDKVGHGMGDLKAEFAPQHENILYATKGRYEFGSKRPKTIIQCMRVSPEKLNHPNEKPVKLLIELIKAITDESDLIFDPFLGSGTTAVAAYQLGRNFIGCELSPEYCRIAEKRLQDARFTLLEGANP